MKTYEINEIVLEIFGSLFPGKSTAELGHLKKDDESTWDSMIQVNLVAALEGEFDVAIELNDAIGIRSLSDAVSLIETLIEE